MKEENDKALCEKYPKMFEDRHAPMQTTAMCWGFDCGDGWFDIIDKLCEDIQKVCDKEGFQLKAAQVKEKFGGLRFYISRGNDEIYNLIRKAEEQSLKTCETCGKPGSRKGNHWIYAACEDHTKPEDK